MCNANIAQRYGYIRNQSCYFMFIAYNFKHADIKMQIIPIVMRKSTQVDSLLSVIKPTLVLKEYLTDCYSHMRYHQRLIYICKQSPPIMFCQSGLKLAYINPILSAITVLAPLQVLIAMKFVKH